MTVMLTDPAQRIAVSNLGWVDRGSVWRYDPRAGRPEQIELSEVRYLTLRGGTGELFAAVHHFDGERLAVTLQPYADPAQTAGRIEVVGGKATLSGDLAAWETVPAHHVAWLKDGAGGSGYFLIARKGGSVEVISLDWFDSSYDWGYQSVVAVEAIPERGELVFGVARSSRLVVTDAATPGTEKRSVELAGAYGNPVPRVRPGTRELWAVDYDTVVRVDVDRWKVTRKARLQHAFSGTRMFVGEPWFSPDGAHVLVPRPGSGDVVLLRSADLSTARKVATGRQPLVAAVLHDGRVLARDWKTGEVLTGSLP